MHMGISQEPFCMEICRDGHFTRAILCGRFTRQMPDPNPATTILCDPAQSFCTWTFHKSHKSHFVSIFTGKCRTRMRTPRLNTGPLLLHCGRPRGTLIEIRHSPHSLHSPYLPWASKLILNPATRPTRPTCLGRKIN